MLHRFQFETEIYPTLKRIPLHVRMKLDITGTKISLQDWLAFTLEERTVLCHLPIDLEEEQRAFIGYLDFLSRNYRSEPVARTDVLSSSIWDTATEVPKPVIERSFEQNHPVTFEEWVRWKPYQRYALYKTAISKSEPETFFAVLDEFRQAEF